MRGGRLANVLLEEVLRDSLKRINRIQHKGDKLSVQRGKPAERHPAPEERKYDGLLKTNESVYDLLTLGVALEQSVEGAVRSFTLNYIDWKNPENNVYHVTAEFSVERTRSHETARPDIVLFVNGIPFAVIECKSPNTEVAQAVSQMIRNQRDEYIPTLFTYAQLVIGTNKNHCKYATVGTAAKYLGGVARGAGREGRGRRGLAFGAGPALAAGSQGRALRVAGRRFRACASPSAEYLVRRALTEQDRTIYALCRPERLLRMALAFTVFDGGRRKIARYQQFFAVNRIIGRVKQRDDAGRRAGGIVWHTQGSGKSLTMVMLAKALVLDLDIRTPRIVLVTDRVDLDKQLGNTFAACGLTPDRAESGRHLVELVADSKAHIVTTLIHKFDKALSTRKFQDESTEIFVLVDETQRTQLGMFSARMRQMFPNACYIGFTGTPLLKREKSDVMRFGGIIHTYADQPGGRRWRHRAPALRGAAGRDRAEQDGDRCLVRAPYRGPDAGAEGRSEAEVRRAEMLNKADQVIYMRAFDISAHFRQNWQGTGFKAQLVAPSKVAALKYKAFLDDIGEVT